MTKKDFVLIASTIQRRANRAVVDEDDPTAEACEELAHRFAEAFAGAYPNFKSRVFLDACRPNNKEEING